jgi:4-amino-4-deoxy-L-arabinose transferase-like glycosyltransferase
MTLAPPRPALHPETGHRTALAATAAAVVLAAWLRLAELDAVGLASDEAVYAGQAAALAGDATRGALFSLFRAHPVVFQLLLSVVFRIGGVSDVSGRAFVGLAFGAGTVVLVAVLAWRVAGPATAVLSTVLLGVMPYHVFVTRQILLDGPMTFFLVLAAVCAERAATTSSERAFVACAAAVGFATITKETAILAGPAILLALVIGRRTRSITRSSVALATVVGGLLVIPFLFSRLLRAHNAGQTLLWQLTRPPNHEVTYFGEVLLAYVGPVLLALAALGLVLQLRRHTPGDLVIAVPAIAFAVFHQMWPTKLLPYLTLLTPAIAIAAAFAVVSLAAPLLRRTRRAPVRVVGAVLGVVLTAMAVVPAARRPSTPAAPPTPARGGSWTSGRRSRRSPADARSGGGRRRTRPSGRGS